MIYPEKANDNHILSHLIEDKMKTDGNESNNCGIEKTLHKMSLNELGQLFPIVLQDYSENWIYMYEAERKRITDSFQKSEIIKIDHIGSTAIPNIKAKPIIDLLVQISERMDIITLKNTFNKLGFLINEHPENPPPHLSFVTGYTQEGFKGQAFHVHIRYQGDWDEIRFRDYLINNGKIAKEYEILKMELAKKFKNDREAYTNSKTLWIENINKLTRE